MFGKKSRQRRSGLVIAIVFRRRLRLSGVMPSQAAM
jgi:hypothetical protein